VYSVSGTRFPDGKGSGAATSTVALDLLGLRSATCPAALDPASLRGELRAACAARLAGLTVQQGSPVPNARTHVYKAPDVRVIMGLQNV
jgi:hypothetical protein